MTPSSLTSSGPISRGRSTEYGTPRNNAAAPSTYGWVGGKKRSANALGGLTLMGVRLYNPATGRFLSVDPVPGGNANAYTYPSDPINGFDLDGMCPACAGVIVVGTADAWNPVGWAILGTIVVVGGGYYVVKHYSSSGSGSSSSGKSASTSYPDQAEITQDFINYAHSKKTPSKNGDREGHSKGNDWQKHSDAQSHGGRKKFINPNKRPPKEE